MKHWEYFIMEKIWIEPPSSRREERITQYAATILFEKGNMRIGIVYSKINIGG